jgi:integrase-like protein
LRPADRPGLIAVVRPVVSAADKLLAERGHLLLPDCVTAHKLRHTFASILFVRGEDPPYVMAQLGHSDPGFTRRVYARAMRRDEGDKERLKAFVEGRDWAHLDTSEAQTAPEPASAEAPNNDESPQIRGLLTMGAAGFEPATSRV